MTDFVGKTRGKLIVSCQALEFEPLHGSELMARMAIAAQQGGAAGIRADGPADIAEIRSAVSLPIIGIYKDCKHGSIYITPTFEHAQAVAKAGAEVIALDATQHPRPEGESLAELIARIHTELRKPVLGDISTLEEAIIAADLGIDYLATTLVGYTRQSPPRETFDFDLLSAMVSEVKIPVFAEGRITTPEEARAALDCGAWGVVVGSAITRPQWITERFVDGMLV
jgi:N-acylglucosamine-6-phosphate 2-epimerase